MDLKNKYVKFFVHLMMYAAIVFGCYFLYNPGNDSPENKTQSSSSFIYQQF